MKQILSLYNKCKKSDSIFFIVVIRLIFIKVFYKKTLFLHQNVKIKGLKNIESKGMILIGLNPVGFIHKTDKTYLNIQGKLIIKDDFSIGRGCRFDIGKNAIVELGSGSSITCNTNLIIMHHLKIGDNCIISWDCQFLDSDFHEISYSGKKDINNSIIIGNNVWIGCGVKIYKGTVVSDGCVIASNSIVKGVFLDSNSLIGGNPAMIIKEKIEWKN